MSSGLSDSGGIFIDSTAPRDSAGSLTHGELIDDELNESSSEGEGGDEIRSELASGAVKSNRTGHGGHQPSLVPVGIVSVPSGSNQASETTNTNTLSDSIEKLKLNEKKKSESSSKPNAAISYAAERVIGNGSFGVVYQATVIETGETVAIKKVLQDKRFKNRELQIMSTLSHPSVVALKHCFYSKGDKPDEVYLNLVMEYIPETLHRTLRNHTKANKLVPITYVKCYMYQLLRSVAYIHTLGVCHRDIKPQNILLNAKTHCLKLCDFGSAKILVAGEPNVSYICSRYYRAPELVFEATEYTPAIDVWSVGCKKKFTRMKYFIFLFRSFSDLI